MLLSAFLVPCKVRISPGRREKEEGGLPSFSFSLASQNRTKQLSDPPNAWQKKNIVVVYEGPAKEN